MHYDDQALISIMEQAATRNHEPAPRPERAERPERPAREERARPASAAPAKADSFDFSVFDKAMKKEQAQPKEEPESSWNWPTDKFERSTERTERPAPSQRKPAAPRPGGLWESA
jgi:hypothetical protein